ncbi:hypothetical protein H6F77_11695 [Microcoleus sp. FACHB-831]|uniref:hypothetical protein n=1 Tax=Microcoleus sp. FACHB-831 TaxID=2692827 RepID=UPI00168889D8|nr:hypothetical protein [Microcoleus sp. FACHB-831]MBD1921755.1 hypothetical protein [Microcoleus sp. FACHB-831]
MPDQNFELPPILESYPKVEKITVGALSVSLEDVHDEIQHILETYRANGDVTQNTRLRIALQYPLDQRQRLNAVVLQAIANLVKMHLLDLHIPRLFWSKDLTQDLLGAIAQENYCLTASERSHSSWDVTDAIAAKLGAVLYKVMLEFTSKPGFNSFITNEDFYKLAPATRDTYAEFAKVITQAVSESLASCEDYEF